MPKRAPSFQFCPVATLLCVIALIAACDLAAQDASGRGATTSAPDPDGPEDSTPAPSGRGGGLFNSLARVFSGSVRALDAREAELRRELTTLPEVPTGQQSERIGYHSTQTKSPDTIKWIQADLGETRPMDAIVLVPVDVPYGSFPGPGYGFPLRFRVEVSDDPTFAEPVVVASHRDEDFRSPGDYPVVIPTPDTEARYVRVTATRLWQRSGFSIFTLGELMVLRGNLNIAASLPERALQVRDSVTNRPTWGVGNLVDGQSVLGAPVGSEPSPRNGYESKIERNPTAAKWVQIDLGSEMELEEVRLLPARPQDVPDRRGFGFPVRFRVEASNDPTFSKPIMLMDQTRDDFDNPAENPVPIPAGGKTARYVRVTATRLWERNRDYVFALSEVQVYSGGQNVALGANVSALDSSEVALWTKKALVDGFNSQQRLVEWPVFLNGLAQRRQLETELQQLLHERDRLLDALLMAATRWTGAGVLSIALGLSAAAWRYRVARRREVERLRNRIARDLHDEIGSNLGSIALLSQVAQSHNGNGEEARHEFAEINRIARQTADSMRDIVWLINPETEHGADLYARMREVSTGMLSSVEHTFKAVPGALPADLSLDFKRNFFLVFKEALHNIVKHAHATRVDIFIRQDDGRVRLEIRDNGCGFDPEHAYSGTGLRSLRQRAESLGGELRIDSEPGRGTTLVLTANPK